MSDITSAELLNRIHRADADEMTLILSAAAERFGELWPDWELATVPIPGHTAEAHVAAFQQVLELFTNRIHKK